MKVKVRYHADPVAVAVTKSFFDYNPYNGMFESEMMSSIDRDLKTVDGCKTIIEDLNGLFAELMQDHNRLIGEYAELKRGCN